MENKTGIFQVGNVHKLLSTIITLLLKYALFHWTILLDSLENPVNVNSNHVYMAGHILFFVLLADVFAMRISLNFIVKIHILYTHTSYFFIIETKRHNLREKRSHFGSHS